MADADHSPAFWSSLATALRSDPGVVFDLYNEPHDISWSCWLNGCWTARGWKARGWKARGWKARGWGGESPGLEKARGWNGGGLEKPGAGKARGWKARGWKAAGMQSLLDAVRSTGATQPVLAAGLNWGGDLSGWLTHEPSDPDHQLAASAHIYSCSACNTVTCSSPPSPPSPPPSPSSPARSAKPTAPPPSSTPT